MKLADIKAEPALAKMELIRQPRLSVSPVLGEEWAKVLEMASSAAHKRKYPNFPENGSIAEGPPE